MTRAGPRQSWLVGLGLGIPAGFLVLEFPVAGLIVLVGAAVVEVARGRAVAGFGGLLVGLGLTWAALFGRIKLTCHPAPAGAESCVAPTIDDDLVASTAVLAVGLALTWLAWRQTRAS